MKLALIVGAVMLSALASFGLYHTITVMNLSSKINSYVANEAIYKANEVRLLSDIDDLKISNASLEATIKAKQEEMMVVQVELNTLRAIDSASEERVKELENKLSSKSHKSREASISNGRRRTLLLKYTNYNVACELDNISNPDGKCVAGVWRPTDPYLTNISYRKDPNGIPTRPRKTKPEPVLEGEAK